MKEITDYRFRISDLSRLDKAALAPRLTGTDAVFEEPMAGPTGHGELATLLLLGGVGMLGTVAAHLFGKYKKKQISLEIEIIQPDGVVKRMRLNLDELSVEPVENQILKQLKDFLGTTA